MHWRVIVRFSLEGDDNSTLRNHLAAELEAVGITRTRTGSWESPGMPAADAAQRLGAVLTILSQAGANARAPYLDHLWVYIDGTDLPLV
jgi:hypothetical protein